MYTGHFRPVALAAILVAGTIALPACDKKKPVGDAPPNAPADSNDGRKLPQRGNADPTLPTPPGRAPLLGTANAASRAGTQAQLKEIGMAFYNAESANGAFPQGIADSTGKVGLSWRVALLPYLDMENLYRQFKLDEPWDSVHNKKLIAQMPKVYAPPRTDTNGYTYYRSFSGPNTVMPPAMHQLEAKQFVPAVKPVQISDGTANTLLVAEATEPVIWTKPDELAFTPGKPPKLGGGVFSNGFCALLCDGSTRFIPSSVDATTLCNAIQINDGNPVNFP